MCNPDGGCDSANKEKCEKCRGGFVLKKANDSDTYGDCECKPGLTPIVNTTSGVTSIMCQDCGIKYCDKCDAKEVAAKPGTYTFTCKTCINDTFDNSAGDCACKGAKSVISNECKVPSCAAKEYVNASGVCTECPKKYKCGACKLFSDGVHCTTCDPALAVSTKQIDNERVECQCKDLTFWNYAADPKCEACHAFCKYGCEGKATNCFSKSVKSGDVMTYPFPCTDEKSMKFSGRDGGYGLCGCQEGFEEKNNTCVQKVVPGCAVGEYKKSDDKCYKCPADKNCLNCQKAGGSEDGECTACGCLNETVCGFKKAPEGGACVCKDGWRLKDGKCVLCPSSCKKCNVDGVCSE
jgi:hypothetical protein